jgi:glucan-binding YG repeat protein
MRKRYAKLLGLACLIGAMGLLPSSQSRAAGWLKDGNYWYYMTDDGQKHTGWVHIGEKYYYMDDSTGKMVTGWRQDSSTSAWYYFNQSGEMEADGVGLYGDDTVTTKEVLKFEEVE